MDWIINRYLYFNDDLDRHKESYFKVSNLGGPLEHKATKLLVYESIL